MTASLCGLKPTVGLWKIDFRPKVSTSYSPRDGPPTPGSNADVTAKSVCGRL